MPAYIIKSINNPIELFPIIGSFDRRVHDGGSALKRIELFSAIRKK